MTREEDMEECPECFNLVIPEEYITETEYHEFWEARVSKEIPIGYICPKCGEEIHF